MADLLTSVKIFKQNLYGNQNFGHVFLFGITIYKCILN